MLAYQGAEAVSLYAIMEKERNAEFLVGGLGSCVEGHLVWLLSRNLQTKVSWNWY